MSDTVEKGDVCFKGDPKALRRGVYRRVTRTGAAVAALAVVVYMGLSEWVALWVWLATLSLLVGYLIFELSRLLRVSRKLDQSELVLGSEKLAIRSADGHRNCSYGDSAIEEVRTRNGAVEAIVLRIGAGDRLKLAGFREMNYVYRELKSRMRMTKGDGARAGGKG